MRPLIINMSSWIYGYMFLMLILVFISSFIIFRLNQKFLNVKYINRKIRKYKMKKKTKKEKTKKIMMMILMNQNPLKT